jgi:hypothetical protein
MEKLSIVFDYKSLKDYSGLFDINLFNKGLIKFEKEALDKKIEGLDYHVRTVIFGKEEMDAIKKISSESGTLQEELPSSDNVEKDPIPVLYGINLEKSDKDSHFELRNY